MAPTAAPIRTSFDISSLESSELKGLYQHVLSYVPEVKIEIVHDPRGHCHTEKHPAATVGLNLRTPAIQFVDSLNREERIESVGHELAHFLLLYRHELGLPIRRRPRPGNGEDAFKYFMNMNKDWFYLLGQIGNTTHHVFLIDYLRKKRGIESNVHLRLLHHNFCLLLKGQGEDEESLFAKGIIAFEHERLIGGIGHVVRFSPQPDLFWRAYKSAGEHFGSYRFPDFPTPSTHQENILSFLEDLGYEREDFTFFP